MDSVDSLTVCVCVHVRVHGSTVGLDVWCTCNHFLHLHFTLKEECEANAVCHMHAWCTSGLCTQSTCIRTYTPLATPISPHQMLTLTWHFPLELWMSKKGPSPMLWWRRTTRIIREAIRLLSIQVAGTAIATNALCRLSRWVIMKKSTLLPSTWRSWGQSQKKCKFDCCQEHIHAHVNVLGEHVNAFAIEVCSVSCRIRAKSTSIHIFIRCWSAARLWVVYSIMVWAVHRLHMQLAEVLEVY